uniref:Uncharacterized protein n=1 Tax=Oryza glaberrima TaxID=4538 RepID=I1QZX7_ORYGL
MQQFNSGGGRTLWSRSGGVQATGGVEEAVTTASGCGGAAGDGDSPRQRRADDDGLLRARQAIPRPDPAATPVPRGSVG